MPSRLDATIGNPEEQEQFHLKQLSIAQPKAATQPTRNHEIQKFKLDLLTSL